MKSIKLQRSIYIIFAACLLFACNNESPSTDKPSTNKLSADKTNHADTIPELRFSAIPDQNTTELKSKFDSLANYISGKLGIPVRYIPSKNYAASVEMFKKGDIQLAWFGGLTGVQARHAVKGARAIVQGIEDPSYVSYFIAHKSVGLQRGDEFPMAIKSLPFAFGSPQSTSGRLMPDHFIQQKTGLSAGNFFDLPVVFSGSHDKTLGLVKTGGAIKAGVLSYKVYEKHVQRNSELGQLVNIIWVTPPYADYNFTAHPALEGRYGEGFTEKLQQTLVDINDPALLSAFPREALIRAKNEDYDAIADIAREQGFIR